MPLHEVKTNYQILQNTIKFQFKSSRYSKNIKRRMRAYFTIRLFIAGSMLLTIIEHCYLLP